MPDAFMKVLTGMAAIEGEDVPSFLLKRGYVLISEKLKLEEEVSALQAETMHKHQLWEQAQGALAAATAGFEAANKEAARAKIEADGARRALTNLVAQIREAGRFDAELAIQDQVRDLRDALEKIASCNSVTEGDVIHVAQQALGKPRS